MSEVTVVCCWTNEKQYQDFVNTLNAQTIPYELIGIDNRGNKAFTSCAAAYNSVINQVRTKYVIYSHQDILLLDTECIAKFLSYLKDSKQDDILGSTGVRFDTVGVFTDTKHKIGNELQYAGKNRLSGSIVEVDTLDECFFGGHTKHFRDYTFDEVLCDDWHLYAAEACLKTKSKYGHRGGAYACGIDLLHLSAGNFSPSLYTGFYRLCRKYAAEFPIIKTCCLSSRTDFAHLAPYCLKYYSRALLRKMLKRIGLYERVKSLLAKG